MKFRGLAQFGRALDLGSRGQASDSPISDHVKKCHFHHKTRRFFIIFIKYAGMAELAYASDLKSDAREGLGVRLPLPAPYIH